MSAEFIAWAGTLFYVAIGFTHAIFSDTAIPRNPVTRVVASVLFWPIVMVFEIIHEAENGRF